MISRGLPEDSDKWSALVWALEEEVTNKQTKSSVTFSPSQMEHGYADQSKDKTRFYLESKRKPSIKGSETTNALTPPGSR